MVNNKKQLLIICAACFILGLLCGFFTGKGVYDRPVKEKVERDTLTLHDTIPDYKPASKDSAHVKYVFMRLPVAREAIAQYTDNTDTVLSENYAHNPFEIIRDSVFREISVNSANFSATDSVAVAIPITSKHYQSKDYDAWVSGFQASLDSIKVYKETQYITEVRTISKPPNKWHIGLTGGYGYCFMSKKAEPYIGIGITYSLIGF